MNKGNFYKENHGNYSWAYHGEHNSLNRTSYLLSTPLDHWATKHLRGGSARLTKNSLVIKAVLAPILLVASVIVGLTY